MNRSKSNKLLSIVIASYNYASYLEQAIKSILNQNFTDYELIIIDGGSTDNSVEIIKKYSDKISYWISEPDNGQSDAFNKGFKQASGKFGFWLNADDILLPNSLSVIAEYIQKYSNTNWFVANTIFFDENYKILRCRKGPKWKDCLIKNGVIYVYGPSSIFSLDLLHKVDGFDINLFYSMDTDLWMRFVKDGNRFIRINHYVWGFRIHEQSKTSHTLVGESNPKFLAEQKYILQKNKWSYSKIKSRLLFMYKFISGSYLKSFIDSKKLKNKSII